jgi:hypothetical protein
MERRHGAGRNDRHAGLNAEACYNDPRWAKRAKCILTNEDE